MTARLSIEHVAKTYQQGTEVTTALRDATLQVNQGELVAIVGPSGSGKTTLLAIAGALLQPTEGRVSIDGQTLSGLSVRQQTDLRLAKIGFILQSSNLVPYLRARDQLELVAYLAGQANDKATQRADQLLAELGMKDRANRYPEAMSGGERQRVAFARALMNDPAVILADEPTANLDSKRGRQMVEMLAHLVRSEGKAGVMVTHDERMLDLCDRVFRIADGQLTAA